jgi:Phage-related tail fibre protein
MAEQFYTILTNVGKSKLASTSTLGKSLNLTNFVLGDGDGKPYNPIETQTSLKKEVWRGLINSIEIDKDNPNWIVISTLVPNTEGGFWIREAGVLDGEGNLIAIGKYPETYKPSLTEGSSKDLYVKLIIEVSNAANVTLKVDSGIIFATKKDIQNIETQIGNINSQVEDYEYQTPTINGAQIQLVKHSDTNILKFKLDSDLSGAITISLDGGATSKNLVDVDGVQLTTLEKGFVEVVADANFFTLRNKGDISTADKQALIDIVNESIDNQSSVKTNLVNTINTKIGSNLVGSDSWINIQNAIGGASIKKWASGSISSNIAPNATYTITGLNFKPTTVILYEVYYSQQTNYSNYIRYYDTITSTYIEMANRVGGNSYLGYVIDMSQGSFTIQSGLNVVGGILIKNWIAFE